METGRVVNRRYLLQRLIKQGQVSRVYQGMDQVLQRVVAVKVVPPAHMSAYRAALKMTAQFSHPNIIGLYDLIAEPEVLYVVQEYVEGDEFATLLQSLGAINRAATAYEVADAGCQMCQALFYAAKSAKVCHGDLTTTAILRDRQGWIRINNFALPSDLYYFTNWSTVGGESLSVSDRELPWGQQTEGRIADDTRAVGLLLYQLLAGRPPGSTAVEPPVDGRLRFLRNIPPELCEVVARAVIRRHPQHINTTEALYTELKSLTEVLEPPVPAPVTSSSQREELVNPQQFSPVGTGKLSSALPVREAGQTGLGLSAYRPESSIKLPAMEAAPAAPTVADIPLKLVTARQAAYPERNASVARRRPSLVLLLLLGLVVFALFFVVGYFAGHLLFP